MNRMLLFVVIMFSCNASGQSIANKSYDWEVNRVLDGDTFEVKQEFFPQELGMIKVRIAGIDTPEKYPRAKCQAEHDLAMKAHEYTKAKLENKVVLIKNIKADKYGGRVVADVYLTYGSFAEGIIKAGLAREYDGRTKKSWCSK